MHSIVRTSRALGDRSRVRIIAALRRGKLCVCQIVELLGLAHSTVSKHLSILNQAGLVECLKNGRWIYYRLPKLFSSSLTEKTILLVLKELEQDETVVRDDKTINRILRMDTEKLCSLQKRKREG